MNRRNECNRLPQSARALAKSAESWVTFALKARTFMNYALFFIAPPTRGRYIEFARP